MPALVALAIPDESWLNLVLPAAVLTVFVATIAYIHNPRIKTLVFSMPVPFTCAYLSTALRDPAARVNATHLTGLIYVTTYHWIVWLIYARLKRPLGVGIAAGVTFYVGASALTAALMKRYGFPPVSWLAPLVFTLWALGSWLYHPVHEPGHRSRAPWYVKMPIIFPIALVLFSLKELLKGAVTTFPYAGVFTSYEMRHSPRTLAGQYTMNNISFILMFLTIWSLEGRYPTPVVLAAGWAVLLTAITVIYRFGFGRPKEAVPVGE